VLLAAVAADALSATKQIKRKRGDNSNVQKQKKVMVVLVIVMGGPLDVGSAFLHSSMTGLDYRAPFDREIRSGNVETGKEVTPRSPARTLRGKSKHVDK
jgi:hypothetical protein